MASVTDSNLSSVAAQPLLLHALGLGPLAMVSHSLLTGLIIGLVFIILLLLSALTLTGVRYFFPHRFRLLAILLVSASWVSVIDLCLQAYFHEVRLFFGIYLPVLAMNALLLAVLEEQVLSRGLRNVWRSLARISTGILLLMGLTGLLREFLSRGAVFTDTALTSHAMGGTTSGLPVFAAPAGAFLVLGCVIALARHFVTGQTGRKSGIA